MFMKICPWRNRRSHASLPSAAAIATGLVVLVAIAAVTLISVGAAVVLMATHNSKQGSAQATTSSRVTSLNGSVSTGPVQCVQIGEPFYPSPKEVSLQSFVHNWESDYQVTVDETTGVVVVHNPTGGGIGSTNVSTLTVPIVSC
jgi:hypothetical protein